MMKKVKQKALKHRAHSVLFNADLPFKPKAERSRVVFRRHSKHRNNQVDQ